MEDWRYIYRRYRLVYLKISQIYWRRTEGIYRRYRLVYSKSSQIYWRQTEGIHGRYRLVYLQNSQICWRRIGSTCEHPVHTFWSASHRWKGQGIQIHWYLEKYKNKQGHHTHIFCFNLKICSLPCTKADIYFKLCLLWYNQTQKCLLQYTQTHILKLCSLLFTQTHKNP